MLQNVIFSTPRLQFTARFLIVNTTPKAFIWGLLLNLDLH